MAAPAPAPFRALVEQRLAALNLSRNQLGQRSGVHPNGIRRWWIDMTPNDATLRKIAPVLQVPFEDLMRAAGRLDDTLPELSEEEQELRDRAEEFKAVLRGIPRVYWGAVASAFTAGSLGMLKEINALIAVSSPADANLTDPDARHIPLENAQGRPIPDTYSAGRQLSHEALEAIVTRVALGATARDLLAAGVLARV